MPRAFAPLGRLDARWLQLAFLTSLLVVGKVALSFDFPAWRPALLVILAVATQRLLGRLLGRATSDWKSPAITALGLSLLLRSDALWVPPLAVVAGISGKLLLRRRGKHLFNPNALGLVMALGFTGRAWVSPSEWGSTMAAVGFIGALGLWVSHRALRSDMSVAFLVSWLLLNAGRALYLGETLPAFLHPLASGGLIVFTFFMISDPKTAPDHRLARFGQAALVAALAFWLRHALWWQDPLFWALILAAPLVPLWDRLLPSRRFDWSDTLPGPPRRGGSSTTQPPTERMNPWDLRPAPSR